jgi:hypothetical protein
MLAACYMAASVLLPHFGSTQHGALMEACSMAAKVLLHDFGSMACNGRHSQVDTVEMGGYE